MGNTVQMKSLMVLTKLTLLYQVMGVVYIFRQASLKALARLTLHGFPLTIKNVISSSVAGPTMVGRYSYLVLMSIAYPCGFKFWKLWFTTKVLPLFFFQSQFEFLTYC